jgi:hypothetical protein
MFESLIKPIKSNKGQAFDVFKLLIAAIVAVAILAILSRVLGIIRTPQGNPTDVITRLVQTQFDNPGAVSPYEEVNFRGGESITAEAIAEKTGVTTKEQLCFVTNINSLIINDGVVTYNGGGSLTLSARATCSTTESSSNLKAKLGFTTEDVSCGGQVNESQRKCVIGISTK